MKRHRYQTKGEVAKQDNTAVNILPLNIKEEERDEFGRSYPAYQDPGTISKPIQLNPNLGFTRHAGESPQMSKYKEDVFNNEVRDAFIDAAGGKLISGVGRIVKPAFQKAYRLNPFATKLNKYNRVIDEGAVLDAQKSGLIRTKAPADKIKGPGLINLDRRGTTAFPSFGDAPPIQAYTDRVIKRGGTPFVISTNRPMQASTLGRHGAGRTMFPVDKSSKLLKSFPASEAQIFEYQPHWLKGYKPVTKYRNKGMVKYQTKGTVTEEEYLAMSPQQRSVLNKNIIKSSSGAYDPDSDLLKSLREAEQMAQQNQADSSRVHNLYSKLNEMVPETTYPRGTTTGSSFATLSPLSSYETYAPWELSELKEKRKNLKFKIGKDMNTMPSMHGEDFPAGAVGWSGHQPLRSRLSADNKVAFTDISLTDHDIRDVRKGRMKNPNGFLRTTAEYARLSKNAIKDKLDGKYNYSDVYFDTYNANRYKPHGRVAPELLLPSTTVPFIDPYPTEKIKPRWANDLADYFRGGPDLKGAELATVDTELQPIQSNWRPKSAGYTSNTAGGYPMMKKDGSTGRVPLGAQFVPGKGYKYTKD